MINKPQPDEHAPYHGEYISLVGNGPILETLHSQQESVYNFFMSLADKADYTYAEGKWTIKEVLGHIIDTERTLAYRVLCFSRQGKELPGFDQDAYVQHATFKTRSLHDLANEYKAVRQANLYLFGSLSQHQQIQKGLASGNPVSVRALVYIIAGHELHHINIIKEKYL